MTETPEPDISLKYFKEHDCSLPKERMSHRISCGKLRRLILSLISVSPSDARARALFRSYASLGAEKYRHYKFYPFTIHPYSKLRLYLELLFVIVVFCYQVVSLDTNWHLSSEISWDTYVIVMVVTDMLYIIHIFINFFTGYVEGNNEKCLVLQLKKASYHYLKTWFFVDLITISYGLYTIAMEYTTKNKDLKHGYMAIFLSSLRILRIPRAFCYLRNIFKAMNVRIRIKTAIEVIFIISHYLTQNFSLQFSLEYIDSPVFKPPRSCSWMTVSQMWNETLIEKLAYGFAQSVRMLRRSVDWHLMEQDVCVEPYLIFAWSIAQMIIFRCTSLYLIIALGTDAAKIKSFLSIQEVQAYMEKLRLPLGFQKRILKFFSIKFHSHYYVESYLLNCVTGKLREDIILHTRWHLVQGIAFLNKLPRPLLMQIAFLLKVEIATAGDVIYKVNNDANCVYFIDRGTITTYTKSGRELYHLEDGDYFGIEAIFTNSLGRYSTTVAVTNCELFRLDKEHFHNTVGRYPSVIDEMKKSAMSRLQWSLVIDEQYKTQTSMRNTARLKGKLI